MTENVWEQRATCAIGKVSRAMDGQILTLGGRIAGVESIPNGEGDPAAVFGLDDGTGRTRAVVPPAVFTAQRGLIREGATVLLVGVVLWRSDGDGFALLGHHVAAETPAGEWEYRAGGDNAH